MSQPLTLDSTVFDSSRIDPETAAFNAQLEAMLAATPPLHKVAPQRIRDAREAGLGIFGPIQRSEMAVERVISGPAGDLPLRIFVPERVDGVYLHIHGGGFMLGRPHHSDVRNEQIARACNLAVVSVDYRLAPEQPYPAGPDDCEAAAIWLTTHAQQEFGSDRLLIGGESAGAALSVATLLRMRDRHGFSGFSAANLVYGGYDLSVTPSGLRWGDRYLVLSTPILHWFADNYAPPERQREPDISTLYADLSALPPALFTVGTMDPLLDDNLFMYARWVAASNEAELAVYPGGVHGFDQFPIALAGEAHTHIDEFLKTSS